MNNRNGYKFRFTEPNFLARLRNYVNSITENDIKAGTIIYYIDVDGKTNFIEGDIKPYSFKYRCDEELDSMNVEIYSDNLDNKLPNLTKIKVVHYATKTNYLPTYDTNGKPENHDDYVISAGTFSISSSDKLFYVHNYEFVEPIYLMKYWSTQTQTVTNMTSITVSKLNGDKWEKKTYTQDETNLYYVIKRMFEITGYKTYEEDCTLDTLIWIKDEELLTNSCNGINDNFMAATVYTNLFKVAKYINRLPVLYFNENYEYQTEFNFQDGKKEYLLFFENKTNGKIIDMESFCEGLIGYSEVELSQRDAGTVVVDAQNMIATEAVWYPAKDCFCAPRTDKGHLGTYSDSTERCIFLPNNINTVKKVRMRIYQGSLQPLDTIEVECLSYSDWLAITEKSERNKYLYFVEGTNKIYYDHYDDLIDASEYKNPGYFILFSVLYYPIMSANIKVYNDSYNETSITQTDAKLDSKSYGKYLNSYIKENGNVDYTIVKNYKSIYIIETLGTKINTGDNLLVISSIDITRQNNDFIVIYGLNKYVSKRTYNITACQNIDNKIIDKEAAQNRMISVSENVFLNFSNTTLIEEEKEYHYIKRINHLVMNYCDNINTTFIDENSEEEIRIENPEVMYISIEQAEDYFALPLSKTICGNSIMFTYSFDDPITLTGGGQIQYFQQDSPYNIYYRYTNNFGKIERLTFKFCEMYEKIDDLGTLSNENSYYIKILPKITYDEYESKENYSIYCEDLVVKKDTKEILNLNFQVNFIPKNKFQQISSKFVELNGLLTSEKINKELYIVTIQENNYKDDVESSIFKINGYHSKVSGNYENGVIIYTLETPLNHKEGQQIALATLKNESYFDILILLDTRQSFGRIEKMYLEIQ